MLHPAGEATICRQRHDLISSKVVSASGPKEEYAAAALSRHIAGVATDRTARLAIRNARLQGAEKSIGSSVVATARQVVRTDPGNRSGQESCEIDLRPRHDSHVTARRQANMAASEVRTTIAGSLFIAE